MKAIVSSHTSGCGRWRRCRNRLGAEVPRPHLYLPKLISRIAVEIENTEPAVMLEPRNVTAVLSYALSGGEGRVVRKLLSLGQLEPTQEKIAKGALAYAEGKYSAASRASGRIEPAQVESKYCRARRARSVDPASTRKMFKKAIALSRPDRDCWRQGRWSRKPHWRREAVLVAGRPGSRPI